MNPVISIVGMGTVGSALYLYFKDFNPLIYDLYKNYPMPVNFFESEFVFICLPTPTLAGRQEVNYVRDFITKNYKHDPIYVIKSTVLPFHAKKLIEEFSEYKIVLNPEFLSSYSAIEDMDSEKNIILGGPAPLCRSVAELYTKVREDLEFHFMSAEESAYLKYAHNIFATVKITFWNSLQDILLKDNIDIRAISRVFKKLPNWNNNYENISADGKRGFGGACFPKDLAAFITHTDCDFLKAVQEKNKRYRDYEIEFEGMLQDWV